MKPRKLFNYVNKREGLKEYTDKHNNRPEVEIKNYTR